MLLSMLHGLVARRAPVNSADTYKRLIANAYSAPLGKSYGHYTLDTLSEKTLEVTTNLPDVSGFLAQTQVNFLLERTTTERGDFIIATAQPFFPNNLGQPVISEHYINALRGRKFIAYQNGNTWTPWKEIGCTSRYVADFTAAASATTELDIDPMTVREYFVRLEPLAIVNIEIGATAKFTHTVTIDFSPEAATQSLNWPAGRITWTSANELPPPAVDVGSRLQVVLKRSEDGLLLGSYDIYKAA